MRPDIWIPEATPSGVRDRLETIASVHVFPSSGPIADPDAPADLLVAAYIWADLRGASPEECLRWAVIYAGLSVAMPTGVGGAVGEARLLEEGAERGLAVPRPAAS